MKDLCTGVTKSGLTIRVCETDSILRGEVVIYVDDVPVELFEISSKQTDVAKVYTLSPRIKKIATIKQENKSLSDVTGYSTEEPMDDPTEAPSEASLEDIA